MQYKKNQIKSNEIDIKTNSYIILELYKFTYFADYQLVFIDKTENIVLRWKIILLHC